MTKILKRAFKALPDLASAYIRALTLSCTCPLPFNLPAIFYFLLPQDLCSGCCLSLKDSTFWGSFSIERSHGVMSLIFLVPTCLCYCTSFSDSVWLMSVSHLMGNSPNVETSCVLFFTVSPVPDTSLWMKEHIRDLFLLWHFMVLTVK